MIVKSRQDTYQYTHDQKQAGFSADVGLDGKPQSFSINGGKTDVDDPNTLTQAQKDKLINQAKLIAGITAAYAGEDVNVAAGVAADVGLKNTISRSKQLGTRLLYSNDGLLYITTDHYQSVTFIGRWK